MASSVYRVTEIIGTSTQSWEDAAKRAVETAAKSLRELRVAEVSELDLTIENGKVRSYRAKVKISFKYETDSKSAAPDSTESTKKTSKKKGRKR